MSAATGAGVRDVTGTVGWVRKGRACGVACRVAHERLPSAFEGGGGGLLLTLVFNLRSTDALRKIVETERQREKEEQGGESTFLDTLLS